MVQVVYTQNALANLEPALVYLAEHDPAAAAVGNAVQVLADHPLIGRCIESQLRELAIPYGKTGYVALYRFVPECGLIRTLAVRHQRGLDFPA